MAANGGGNSDDAKKVPASSANTTSNSTTGSITSNGSSPGRKSRKRELTPADNIEEANIIVTTTIPDSSSGINNRKSNNNTCPLCEKSFSAEVLLETHILASHPGQPLRCQLCPADVVFPTLQAYNIHKYLYHFQRISSLMDFKYPTLTPAPTIIAQTIPGINSLPPTVAPISLPPPLTKHLEGALTRPAVLSGVVSKDKDLADVQSILSIAQNFPGIPEDELKNQNSTNSITAESDICSAQSTTSDTESGGGGGASKRLRLEEGESFLDDDPAIKEMKMKGEFPCSQCPAVFPNLRALKGHNKEHLDKAPYKCNVGTCTYSSNDKSTLTRHMRRHTGEKPFECKVCNFGFTTKANCERHLKNKHRKTTRESVRECLIIHETDETEALLNKMQVNGETINTASTISADRLSTHSEHMDIESDNAFRCKVCKLTFMSKFAVRQHGIHTHPEYASDVDHIAEVIGEKFCSPRGGNGENSLSNGTEDSPLDLSKEKDDDKSIDLTKDIIEDDPSIVADKEPPPPPHSPPKIGRGFAPPGFPMIIPTFPGAAGAGPPGTGPNATAPPMICSYLAAMPYLLSQQGLMPGLQKNLPYGNNIPAIPPMDISSILAAQELAKKQAEFLQQKEAAEALQNLSQAAPPMSTAPIVPPSPTKSDDKQLDITTVIPSNVGLVLDNGKTSTPTIESPKNFQPCDPDEKIDESMYKMVIKNGVLMKKPKQKRYRTERPYSCQSCNAKFTLRSNMERHIKQQHPECWSGKGRGSRKSLAAATATFLNQSHNNMSLDSSAINSSTDFATDRFEDGSDTEKEEDGLLIIDDKSDRRNNDDMTDLASVSRLITTASNQSFTHFLAADKNFGDDENRVGGGEEGGRRSAYSAAPHKIDCPFCFRKFPWTSSLNRHILTHTGIALLWSSFFSSKFLIEAKLQYDLLFTHSITLLLTYLTCIVS